MHRLDLTASKAHAYDVNDRWTDFPGDTQLYSSAFTDCINRRVQSAVPATDSSATLRLVVRAPQLRSGMRLNIVGAQPALGCWNLAKALPMVEHNHNEWIVDLDADSLFASIHRSRTTSAVAKDENVNLEFKFVAFGDKGEVEWETGQNRTLCVEPLPQGEVKDAYARVGIRVGPGVGGCGVVDRKHLEQALVGLCHPVDHQLQVAEVAAIPGNGLLE